jgi:hypothetical protein
VVALFFLALLAVVGLSLGAVFSVVLFVLKMVFWMVLLPIRLVLFPIRLLLFPLRLLMKLAWLPFGLAFGAVGMTLGVAALPILLLVFGAVLVFGLIAAVLSAVIPLIPFILLGLLVWAIFRQRPATV